MKANREVRAYYSPLGRIRMLGGNQVLDLSNTLHWHHGARMDFIPDYEALVRWSVPALLLSEKESEILLEKSAKEKESARDIRDQWSKLRGSLKLWLAEHAVNRNPSQFERELEPGCDSDLVKVLNVVLGESSPEDLFAHTHSASDTANLSLPLLRSAAAIMFLVLFPPEGALRRCEADECGGYFIDRSRAKPRRWCAMDRCGNRAKAKRHREGAARNARMRASS
jgi:predicted RNA-binding Zn ribbon-like protein